MSRGIQLSVWSVLFVLSVLVAFLGVKANSPIVYFVAGSVGIHVAMRAFNVGRSK